MNLFNLVHQLKTLPSKARTAYWNETQTQNAERIAQARFRKLQILESRLADQLERQKR